MANLTPNFADAWGKRDGVRVWISDYGVYRIPPRFHNVRMTRKGWPDKRDKGYSSFMEWVAEEDSKARNG